MNPENPPAFHRWRPAALLRVSGEDSATFLQGQFTNDLQKIIPGGAVYGLWLNQKGKTLADSFVVRISKHEFRVVSYFSAAAVIRERLEAYVIADDVVIEDLTAQATAMTVFGDDPIPSAIPANALTFSGRRARTPHTEIIFPSGESRPHGGSMFPNAEISRLEMERRRINARIPAVPFDIGPADLPNEGGLERQAISFTKGCYLGQEVMARLKSMGQVRRTLGFVKGSGAAPLAPAALFQAGRKIGELRSAVGEGGNWIGLALLSRLQVAHGKGLALDATGPAEIFIGADA
ncbi:MAG: folate-binding protein [Verrucomicrobia bacterium]|nr:folate-binding protein [Verrucomicrobiota bacterium]